MALRNVVNELHDEHSLTDTSTTEQTNLTTFCIWCHQVNDLDASLEDRGLSRLVGETWRLGMQGEGLLVVQRALLIDRLAEHVDNTTQHFGAHWHSDWATGVDDSLATLESLGCIHGNGPAGVFTDVLRNLKDETDVVILDFKGVEDLGKLVIELHVNDGSDDSRHF